MNSGDQHRIDQESTEEKEARLGDMTVRTTGQSYIPVHAVLAKTTAFHKKLAECDFRTCLVCGELFPPANPHSPCTHCNSDKRQPKLYSRENNMDPLFPTDAADFAASRVR